MGKQSGKQRPNTSHPICTAKELLDAIHQRPALYWGSAEHLFVSLVAFLSGFKIGHGIAQKPNGINPEDLTPHDFHRFVTEKFGRKFPDGGKGWMTLIAEHTTSEREAFDLFFQLREEYERAQRQ